VVVFAETILPLAGLQSAAANGEIAKEVKSGSDQPHYLIDKEFTFASQNSSWLWAVVLVPIPCRFVRRLPHKNEQIPRPTSMADNITNG
jgi:hypothetical protein